MGTSPENLESSGCASLRLKSEMPEDPLSVYKPSPLLYHDYDIKLDIPMPSHEIQQLGISCKSKGKTSYVPILPKRDESQPLMSKLSSEDFVYGKLDESANCIIILCDGDENLEIGEAVTEVVTSEEEITSNSLFLNVPENTGADHRILSPYSDCGYESLESPSNNAEEIDVDSWNQSVSQLFPSLVI